MELKAALSACVTLVLLLFMAGGPASARGGDETCETSKAAVKRCVHLFSGGMKSIVYTDRDRDIVEWEINFPSNIDGVWPTALTGSTMALLSPRSSKEERGELFKNLLVNAAKANSQFFVLENYDWSSARLDGEIIMIRASRRTKTAPKRRGIDIGMTAHQVLQSNWGKPRSINTTITSSGKHEQWVYGSGYVYLDKGIVTSIQTSRH